MMMENDKEVQEEKVNTGAVSGATEKTEAPVALELSETDDASEHEEHAVADYSHFSKKEFVELAKELSKDDDFKKVDAVLKEIKPLFDEIRNTERNDALARFKKDGGIEEDFEYRLDEADHAFDATLKLIRDRKNQHFKNLEERKNENLRKKTELLEQLRALIDGEDSSHSFQAFKQLQQEWKQIGAVPMAHVKTLWANYNALIDRFYDHRNIYFELKELDRKKNLDIKLELCAKAERLVQVDKIRDAVKELNDLHHEFKHVGPVPKEGQEAVWQRFKLASDAIYAKRDAHVATLQQELHQNLDAKLKLEELLTPFASFNSDRIKEWNQKTQEILEVQKKWDQAGAIPRAKSKDLNKKFWTAFKAFFHNKNQFFKKLDAERDQNLKAKQELVRQALELKDSADWNATSEKLKELQRKWKDIGPVPEKQREKIFQEFKQACDFFFEQRRGTQEKADLEQDENLKKKEAIIQQLTQQIADGSGSLDKLKELQAEFSQIGFVPKQAMASTRSRFQDLTAKYVNSIQSLNEAEKDQVTLEIQLSGLKNDPQAERKIYQREQTLRKQIQKAENDLAVLRNNLEFFGRSKNAEKMKEEFNDKIKEAGEHLAQLKKQLKLIKTA